MHNVRPLALFAAGLLCAPVHFLGAQAVATASSRVADSLPGQRLRWEMIAVPGGDVTVPGAGGPVRRRVEPFLIGATEVAWELYDVFYLRLDVPREDRARVDAISRPSRPYGAPDHGFGHRGWPAISVTHGGAMRFAAWLSERTGHRYEVATDAQWQRAADAALGGLDRATLHRLAWHAANAEGTTHALASLDADGLGIHDLLGNAAEWVTGEDGTPWLRGGSFLTRLDSLSPITRERQQPSWNQTDPQDPKSRWWLSDGPFAGFRLVRIP